ncbi:hypothetical protein PENSUB_13017 [Penicillium subrubescens]|uniref:Uncharacterized protein n=1 Tax=Penicillium subrubescens TaxID=1316194 RepID=A0A1Q5SUG9_9EURO|nr:hypothetical protein PENSUB_13017 [Penicillium subrubescens]
MEGFELLQNFVSTDEDLEGTMKVEPEGRRQHRKSGRSEGSEAGTLYEVYYMESAE